MIGTVARHVPAWAVPLVSVAATPLTITLPTPTTSLAWSTTSAVEPDSSTSGDGDVICTNGAIVSRTITLNPALVTLPAASVAEQVTRVTPIANPLPEGGKQLIGTVPLTTSKALAAYVTTAPKGLVASATTSGGIVSTGRVVSRTTTRTSDEACFPRPSWSTWTRSLGSWI